jgi:hypothetical protein
LTNKSSTAALLNVISYDTAYSLYPYATFIARQQVPIGLHDGELELTLDQYLTQGWQSITDESCQRIVEPVERWVDDQDSWIIHLRPISDHELASPDIGFYGFKPTQRFPRDPVTVSGWYPLVEDAEERPIMTYSAVVGDALHYSYVTPMTKQPQLALDATRSVNEIMALWGQDLPQKPGPTLYVGCPHVLIVVEVLTHHQCRRAGDRFDPWRSGERGQQFKACDL